MLVRGRQFTENTITNNLGRRNAIINGNFDIWQRGTSFTSMASGTVMADRFKYVSNSSAVFTGARSTTVPTYAQSGLLSQYSLHLDCTTADTTIAATDHGRIAYTVEGYDYSKLAGGNVTLSFWVYATKTGTHCIAVRNSGEDRSYVKEYTVNVTNTWEKKTLTFPMTETGGTWNYTNGAGIEIAWTLCAGTNFHTTADAWQPGNYLATSNQVNVCDNVANNFRIAQVQLEKGDVATPFEYEDYATTLDRCARYYQKSYEIGTAPGTVVSTGAITYRATNAGGHNFDGMWQAFSTELRASPTVTWYSSNTGATGKVYDASAAADVTLSSVSYTSKKRTGNPSGGPAAAGNYLLGHWTADAEL